MIFLFATTSRPVLGLIPGAKRPGRESDRPFVAWCLIKQEIRRHGMVLS